jgi:tetratricopeptide (TPR) repeat protein
MRRMAADLGLIRMLVYYGTPEAEQARREEQAESAGKHGEELFGQGHYREILPRARRIRSLDPRYSYPVLYASGALAFNLGRPQEALDLLGEALKDDPGNEEYKAYVGGIGFAQSGDLPRVIAMLEPTLSRSDCPTMIKAMVALMYRKVGRRDDAARVYRDILATSRDEGYRGQAAHALAELDASRR